MCLSFTLRGHHALRGLDVFVFTGDIHMNQEIAPERHITFWQVLIALITDPGSRAAFKEGWKRGTAMWEAEQKALAAMPADNNKIAEPFADMIIGPEDAWDIAGTEVSVSVSPKNIAANAPAELPENSHLHRDSDDAWDYPAEESISPDFPEFPAEIDTTDAEGNPELDADRQTDDEWDNVETSYPSTHITVDEAWDEPDTAYPAAQTLMQITTAPVDCRRENIPLTLPALSSEDLWDGVLALPAAEQRLSSQSHLIATTYKNIWW